MYTPQSVSATSACQQRMHIKPEPHTDINAYSAIANGMQATGVDTAGRRLPIVEDIDYTRQMAATFRRAMWPRGQLSILGTMSGGVLLAIEQQSRVDVDCHLLSSGALQE